MAVTQDDRDEERDLQELFRQVAESDQEVDAYKLRNILQSQLRAGSNTHALEIPASVCMLNLMFFCLYVSSLLSLILPFVCTSSFFINQSIKKLFIVTNR